MSATVFLHGSLPSRPTSLSNKQGISHYSKKTEAMLGKQIVTNHTVVKVKPIIEFAETNSLLWKGALKLSKKTITTHIAPC